MNLQLFWAAHNFTVFFNYLFFSRGLVGEIDEEQDKQIDLSLIRAEPLQQITH